MVLVLYTLIRRVSLKGCYTLTQKNKAQKFLGEMGLFKLHPIVLLLRNFIAVIANGAVMKIARFVWKNRKKKQ